MQLPHFSWGWAIGFNQLLFSLALGFSQSGEPVPECTDKACLLVLPQVCVTRTPEQPCEQQVRVEWSTPAVYPELCLTIDDQQLRCWQDQQAASWQDSLTWPTAAELKLTDPNGPTLVSVSLMIQSLTPGQRRRLGSPWSVF